MSAFALGPVASAIAKEVAGGIVKGLVAKSGGSAQIRVNTDAVEDSVGVLEKEAVLWSSHVVFSRAAGPVEIEQVYIPLSVVRGDTLSAVAAASGDPITIEEILDNREHTLILGEPGAGKTTTLRHLCRMLLTMPPVSDQDLSQFPVAIQFRETVFQKLGLIDVLLARFGISVTKSDPQIDDEFFATVRRNILVNYLNQTRPCLILDGLDELSSSSKELVYRDIVYITSHTTSCMILLSSRFQSISRSLPNVRIVSIRPLDYESMAAAATKWFCGDSVESRRFMEELRSKPYSDVARTPLHLANMLWLYSRQKKLPDRHVDIYRRVVRLRIYEWDDQRGIDRDASLAYLTEDFMLDLLPAVAFGLRQLTSALVFSRDQLYEVITRAQSQLRFEVGQVRQIADELCSATGLIEQLGEDKYQFYHKTIQEYFCGDHICRSAATLQQSVDISGMPDECAMSIVLSTAPAKIYTALAANSKLPPDFWVVCLHRLSAEMASFPRDSSFGMAVLKTLGQVYHYYKNNSVSRLPGHFIHGLPEEELDSSLSLSRPDSSGQETGGSDGLMYSEWVGRFWSLAGVRESVLLALGHYVADVSDYHLGVKMIKKSNIYHDGVIVSGQYIWVPHPVWRLCVDQL